MRWSGRCYLLLAALASAIPIPAAPASSSLSVRALSRSLAPGEPVRIVVRSETALASLEGSFLDQPLFFVRDDRSIWSAWSLVDLDRRPGNGAIEVRGRTLEGTELRARRSIRVLPKKFPVQRLEVESKYVSPPPEVEERLVRERARLTRVYATRTVSATPSLRFVRPVPGEATSIFGARRILNGTPRDPHPGLDLRARPGTPVRAAGPGRVELAEDLYYSGGTVILDHGGGLFTVYAHLSTIDVRPEDRVRAGEVVGASGATGRVTGPHLHWGAKIGDEPFDPTALLDARLFATPTFK